MLKHLCTRMPDSLACSWRLSCSIVRCRACNTSLLFSCECLKDDLKSPLPLGSVSRTSRWIPCSGAFSVMRRGPLRTGPLFPARRRILSTYKIYTLPQAFASRTGTLRKWVPTQSVIGDCAKITDCCHAFRPASGESYRTFRRSILAGCLVFGAARARERNEAVRPDELLLVLPIAPALTFAMQHQMAVDGVEIAGGFHLMSYDITMRHACRRCFLGTHPRII